MRENAMKKSKILMGNNSYFEIYDNLNDSIENWIDNKIANYAYWNTVINYQVDSIICINEQKDKLITSILLPYVSKDGLCDQIQYFYGVKIRGQWYFFGGPTLVLPRKYYQKDIHIPLSFEKLKQIATSHIYRNYLYKNKQGESEINERFFSDLTSGAWCTDCITQEDWDKKYLSIINENWSKRNIINHE